MGNKIAEILERFGIDSQCQGAYDFTAFVMVLALKRSQDPQMHSGAGDLLRDMAKKRGEYYLAFDQRMKRAIRPILDADTETLKRHGIYLSRPTVCGLAWALSTVLLRQS